MGDNALRPKHFIRSAKKGVLLDVRTPAEFAQGHIPGAINFPLFSNEERAEIGTLYKQESREAAIDRGFEIVGPKMADWIKTAREKFAEQDLHIHCWRGGMRSANMAWLFTTAGFVCFTLRGGYKAYRQMVLKDLMAPWRFIVLGGYTGSGKTDLLHHLQQKGEQVIDLEKIANHRGSAFGQIGEQPTSEQFANLLHAELSQLDPEQPIWIEDESRLIGKVYLPDEFMQLKRESPLLFMQLPQEERAQYLAEQYGKIPVATLKASFQQIKKRLGDAMVQEALEALDRGDITRAAAIALHYYDKAYVHSLRKHTKHKIKMVSFPKMDIDHMANQLMEEAKTTIP